MSKHMTVQDLAAWREIDALHAAAESTLEAAKIADRERSGLLMRGNGTLVRKRKREGVYVSAVKSVGFGVSGTNRPQVQCVPGVEVRVWDAMVKADRMLVAMGCRSSLVKRATDAQLSGEQRMRVEAMRAKQPVTIGEMLAVAVDEAE